jgi:eukaryotic-like serine/threonine-protein kinase
MTNGHHVFKLVPQLELRSMAKANKKPWEERWRRVRQLGRGGQGVTFLVEHVDVPGEHYVLKELRNNADLERRKRMHREVQALQQLDHPRLPKIVESNTNAFADLDVPLFFVMDYVDGQTLEERVAQGQLKPDEAIGLVIELSDVLIYCHQKGIIHRDIKQDNIILRRGNSADPVLIDFGLSFNGADENQSPLTPDGQQLGNRLLHLPELQVGDSTKRYVESDISQVCAVLFYVLTGKAPVALADHEGLKPHQRASVKPMLGETNSPALIALFDKGFEGEFTKRFRSFEAFKGRLYEVRDEFKYAYATFSHESASVALESVMPDVQTTPTESEREKSKQNQTEKESSELWNDLGGERLDALMFSSLLGSWSDKVEGDNDAIRRLIEGDD